MICNKCKKEIYNYKQYDSNKGLYMCYRCLKKYEKIGRNTK